MKKILLFTIIIASSSIFSLNAQSWQWAKHFGGASTNDWGGSFCLDSSGNSYLTGAFGAPYGIFGDDTIDVVGSLMDVYIVKVDFSGNFVWAKRAGGDEDMFSGGENGCSILFDHSTNSIIFCGNMDGSSYDSIGTCNIGGGDNIFLSKLDTSGNCIWAIKEPNGYPGVTKITIGNNGDIYMIGQFLNSSIFGGIPLPAGGFLAKFNASNGVCIWAKKIVEYENTLTGLSFYNNHLYIGGLSINDTLLLDSAPSYCFVNDAFISEFNTAGNLQWVKTMGGPNNDYGGGLCLDANGNIYTVGYFQDTAYFDTVMLSNGDQKDWFLAKYNNNGNIIWARHANAIGNIFPTGVSVSGDTNVYVSGGFSDEVTFGSYNINASSMTDLFIARYNGNGNCLGVRHVGNIPYGGVILAGNAGDFYTAGFVIDTANFDSHTIISYGGKDVFIARHDAITGTGGELKIISNQLVIYANPNEGKCNIIIPDEFMHEKNLTLSIFDNSGKIIQQKTLTMNDGKIKLDLEAEAKGIYNVSLTNGKKMYSGKIVFQ